jgi:hypothetical protein
VKFLDTEHVRLSLLHLHQHGRELTPDELREIAHIGLEAVRKAMRAEGKEVPDDDEALFLLLQEGKHATGQNP